MSKLCVDVEVVSGIVLGTLRRGVNEAILLPRSLLLGVKTIVLTHQLADYDKFLLQPVGDSVAFVHCLRELAVGLVALVLHLVVTLQEFVMVVLQFD